MYSYKEEVRHFFTITSAHVSIVTKGPTEYMGVTYESFGVAKNSLTIPLHL